MKHGSDRGRGAGVPSREELDAAKAKADELNHAAQNLGLRMQGYKLGAVEDESGEDRLVIIADFMPGEVARSPAVQDRNEAQIEERPCVSMSTPEMQAAFEVSAGALAECARECLPVLRALASLRSSHEGAVLPAVDLLMEMRAVRLVHHAWQVLDLLAEEEGSTVFDLFDAIGHTEVAVLILNAVFGGEAIPSFAELMAGGARSHLYAVDGDSA